MTSLVVVSSAVARASAAARSSGSRRTGITSAGPEPIDGRPPRGRSVAASYPASASAAMRSMSASGLASRDADNRAVRVLLRHRHFSGGLGSIARYWVRIGMAWIAISRPSSTADLDRARYWTRRSVPGCLAALRSWHPVMARSPRSSHEIPSGPDERRVSCTPAAWVLSWTSVAPPAGIEPATCGLGIASKTSPGSTNSYRPVRSSRHDANQSVQPVPGNPPCCGPSVTTALPRTTCRRPVDGRPATGSSDQSEGKRRGL